MPFEKFENAEAIDKERRKAIVKSIRIISVEELLKLGEEMFDDPDRPHFIRRKTLDASRAMIRSPLMRGPIHPESDRSHRLRL